MRYGTYLILAFAEAIEIGWRFAAYLINHECLELASIEPSGPERLPPAMEEDPVGID